MHIEVTREVFKALLRAASEAHPREACGILLGEAGRVAGLIEAANAHPNPRTHFEIDPQVLIDAHRSARDGGPEVLGYFHSHPVGEAVPSATDQAQSAGDEMVWAIIAGRDIRFWRDRQEGFQALPCTLVGP